MEQSIARIERWFVTHGREPGLASRHVQGRSGHHLRATSALGRAGDRRESLAALGDGRGPRRRRLQRSGQGLRGLLRRAQHVGVRRSEIARAAEAGRHVPAGAADERRAPMSRRCGSSSGRSENPVFEIGLLHPIVHVIGSRRRAPRERERAFRTMSRQPDRSMYGPGYVPRAGTGRTPFSTSTDDDYYRAQRSWVSRLSNKRIPGEPFIALPVRPRPRARPDALRASTTSRAHSTVPRARSTLDRIVVQRRRRSWRTSRPRTAGGRSG